MIIITLDKGLETERSVQVDRITERPIAQSFVGSRVVPVSSVVDMPDLSNFLFTKKFSTLVAKTSDGVILPINNSYNTIIDAIVNYDDSHDNGVCSITLTFGASTEEIN